MINDLSSPSRQMATMIVFGYANLIDGVEDLSILSSVQGVEEE